jgi:HAMP domain-containing protein
LLIFGLLVGIGFYLFGIGKERYGTFLPQLIGYAWMMGVFGRKARYKENEAGQPTPTSQVLRGFQKWTFLLFLIAVAVNYGFSAPLLGLPPFTLWYYVYHLLLFIQITYSTILFLNFTTQPTSFQVKVVGLVLCPLLIILALTPLLLRQLILDLPNYSTVNHRMSAGFLILIPLTTLTVIVGLPRFLRSNLLSPLNQILEGVRQVDSGNLSVQVPVAINDEVGKLARQFNHMTHSLRRYTQEMEQLVAERTAELEAKNQDLVIEAALERVRSRTMAMHKSDELTEVATVLFQQIKQLGGIPDRFCIGIYDEEHGVAEVYTTDQTGKEISKRLVARLDERTSVQKMYDCWKAGGKWQVIDLQGQDLKDWIRYVQEELGIPVNEDYFNGRRLHNAAYFSQGFLDVISLEPVAPKIQSILQRFASVFTLTYTRFLDLQKAEAQAREAQIEASLERVRARAMAIGGAQMIYTLNDQLVLQ